MAYSYTSYAADGSTNTFALSFPYISKAHVTVLVDGVATTFTWPTLSTITTTDTAASLAGKLVTIRRNTSRATRLVDFQDAANLTEAILDQSALQMFYLAQENLDDASDKMALDATDLQWDARSLRIKAVATPTAGTDAVNKTYADSTIAAAAASAAASAVSAAAALVSEGNADTSEAAALASANAADVSEAAALASEIAAAASVASLTLPTIAAANKGQMLAVNNAASGYSFVDSRNRNRIINGNFDIWQRGTTSSVSTNGPADCWNDNFVGGSMTASRQSFTLGQTDVPGEPQFFHRQVVTHAVGAGNLHLTSYKIESVRTFAGQTCTLRFFAKADAVKNMAVGFAQIFGTGGAPSAGVVTSITTVALTTAWQEITITVTLPSIAGKTLGTSADDYLRLYFWYEAGSTFNAETNSLGQQSGTFDIARVQLEGGTVATPFEERSIGQELALCQRYFQLRTYDMRLNMVASAATNLPVSIPPMRVAPVCTWKSTTASVNVASSVVYSTTASDTTFQVIATASADTYRQDVYSLSADLP